MNFEAGIMKTQKKRQRVPHAQCKIRCGVPSSYLHVLRGDTLYSFEVAVAPSMLNSATPMLILHSQYFYPKASQNRQSQHSFIAKR